ncbi:MULTISPECIES: hypothetical protein [Alteromonadaceae]|uniref:hypothetical protein n=1 Tax=Alteromonadaceae TaxID=72275 RepID=UPI001C07F145|nr:MULTISPECIES: hypothetical protein [Aliiglaciecola]MBU2876839.1 hypothetical protein [Aliiglaciecola lipolytica]MDO6711942.1 hypothetical protein [Aliiglaciecola sp. 2_MG-2023]MDO6753084.1 hypothetical protein [Aliiglaciecola sp. 1_MG-2023]
MNLRQIKKQKKSIQKVEDAVDVSSSPCDMARFADYFLGLDKEPKKPIEAKLPIKHQEEPD